MSSLVVAVMSVLTIASISSRIYSEISTTVNRAGFIVVLQIVKSIRKFMFQLKNASIFKFIGINPSNKCIKTDL